MLSQDIRYVINEAGFKTFFQALLDHDTTEYKDVQLLVALSERFWDHLHLSFSRHWRGDVDIV